MIPGLPAESVSIVVAVLLGTLCFESLLQQGMTNVHKLWMAVPSRFSHSASPTMVKNSVQQLLKKYSPNQWLMLITQVLLLVTSVVAVTNATLHTDGDDLRGTDWCKVP